jgi:hypothetical protein
MKAMKMGLEGLLIQNSALTIPSVTRPFAGKNMLWPITYIFCLVKDWEFCKLFSVQWSLKRLFFQKNISKKCKIMPLNHQK